MSFLPRPSTGGHAADQAIEQVLPRCIRSRYPCTKHPGLRHQRIVTIVRPGPPSPAGALARPVRWYCVTQPVIDIAKPFGIAVHDHIIVGKDGHASLKGLKLM